MSVIDSFVFLCVWPDIVNYKSYVGDFLVWGLLRLAPTIKFCNQNLLDLHGLLFQVQWESICEVWGLNGVLVSLGVVVYRLTALWY